MALIKTYTQDDAKGKVKEIYDALLQRVPMIPKPFQMMSASPDLLAVFSKSMDYFMQHPSLSMQLMAMIRLLSAFHGEYPYCIDLNSMLLKNFLNLSDEQLSAVRSDPSQAPLPDNEKAMLLFVLKAIKTPEAVEKTDIDALYHHGWKDSDILDATFHGASMISSGLLFNVFKMGDV